MHFKRISIDHRVMLGKPCIKNTRITAELILGKLAGGASIEWVLDAYPHIKREDILESLGYAKAVLANEEIIEATSA